MRRRRKLAQRYLVLGVLLWPTIGSGQTPTATPTPFDRPSFCRTPDLAIPDNEEIGVDDSLVVPSNVPIADLDVLVRITHPFVGDIVVRLTHVETGTFATLIDRPLFPDDPQGCVRANVDTLLDDEAAMPAEDACEPPPEPALRGRLVPNDPLDNFDGEILAGTWTLNVSDRSGTDEGTLDAWCLVYASSALPTTPTVTPTATPTFFTSTPTQTRTITATQPAFTGTPTETTTPTGRTVTATVTVTPTGPIPTSTNTPIISPTPLSQTPTVSVSSTSTPTDTPTPPDGATSTPTPSPTSSARPSVCTGDCNLDDEVTVDELVVAVEITLSRLGMGACPALDADGNDVVTIDEPVAAVFHAVSGCD